MNRFKKFTLALALVLLATLVVVATAVVHHYQLKAAVAHYRADLKAQGEPLELAQVIPPPVPPEQNYASQFTNAIALFGTNDNVLSTNLPLVMHMVAPGKAAAGWRQPRVMSYLEKNTPTNSWEDLGAALAEIKPALDALRQLPEKPVFDFGYDYSQGYEVKFTPLTGIKRATQKLSASTVFSLRQGDTATATKYIQATLALIHGFSHDRILLFELSRMAMTQIALTDTWELLQATNLTDDQLAALQQSWADLEFTHSLEGAMTFERFGAGIEVAKDRAINLQPFFGKGGKDGLWDVLKAKIQTRLWRYWWSYPDEMRYLQGMQVILGGLRQAETNQAFLPIKTEMEKRIDVLIGSNDNPILFWSIPTEADFHFFMSSSLGTLAPCFDKLMQVKTTQQMAITAIALKRYQLRHGQLPETLAALVPELVPSVPIDPFDGQPLKYRRHADGTFLLYSVAENGVDDGGDPTIPTSPGTRPNWQWQHPKARDWVWPQPATAAEVQAFLKTGN